jgi:hypothetical protein
MFFQEKKEELAIWATDKLNQDYPKRKLWIVVGVSFIGNLLSWFVPLMAPAFLAEPAGVAISIESRIGVYLLVIPLASVTVMTFSLIKLYFPPPAPAFSKDDVFALYDQKNTDDRNRKMLLISLGFGAVNCILLVFTVITVRVVEKP